MSAAPEYQCIRVARSEDGFATIELHRPDKLNTLSRQLRREFAHAIAVLEADPAMRVLIVTGAGRAFTAGMDLDEWGAGDEPAAGAYDNDPVQALLSFSGPVIGAINGLAITGGVEIALACDLLIASTAARFADTHAQVGLLPGWGGSVRMVQRIGLARAKELALTGRFLGAEEALAWGFVNHVVPPEQLLPKAEELARQMSATVPDTLVAYKKLLDAEAATTLAEGLRIERDASRANNTRVGREQIDERLALLRHRKR
jgi:enoyl-CoA hydratase